MGVCELCGVGYFKYVGLAKCILYEMAFDGIDDCGNDGDEISCRFSNVIVIDNIIFLLYKFSKI